ncbi:hypothetical protein Bca4012_041281 [Brassica carinata]|uniref:Uncharacterized protein n=1 Tax=Brassica carinata TaxID=52824 RepID=A0A8X7QYK0_BRACI|nr:hypothetical protein Bca52824_060951 [Brassica carinata]
MFALGIPLPGKHPLSPCSSNSSFIIILCFYLADCSEKASFSAASNGKLQEVFDSFQSLRLKPSETKISPAMNSLQGYYGLKPTNRRASKGL